MTVYILTFNELHEHEKNVEGVFSTLDSAKARAKEIYEWDYEKPLPTWEKLNWKSEAYQSTWDDGMSYYTVVAYEVIGENA